MKRAVLGSVMAALLMLFGVTIASPVLAHTELESTSPTDGEALATPPAQIDLVFGEAPLPDAIDLSITDASGAVVASALPATVTENTVSTPWPADLSDGAYTVNYRVVSDDGHPVTGTFSFTIGDATAAPAPASDGAVAETTTGSGVSGLTLGIVAVAVVALVAVAIVLVTRRNRDDVP